MNGHGVVRIVEVEVAPDGIHRVVGKPDDVADVRGNIGVPVGFDQLRVLADVVLLFARCGEITRVDTFHADEDVDATCLPRLADEVLDLPGENVYLHHEFHGDLLFFAQADQSVEDRLPVFVAGKVVVGEKVKGDAVV